MTARAANLSGARAALSLMLCDAHSLLFDSSSIQVKSLFCRGPADLVGYEHEYEASRISLVRSGVFGRVIGGVSVLADATQVLFVNRGDVHRFFHPLDGGDACTVLEPSEATLDEILWHFDRSAKRFPRAQAVVPARVLQAHQVLLGMVERRAPGDGPEVEELSIDICTDLVAVAYGGRRLDTGLTGAAGRRHRIVERVRLALNASVQKPPGLTELSRIAQCSPFHLARVFRAHAGMTVRAYTARLRAMEAARRILEGVDDLASLALELGYYDHSHLTNAFSAVWGVPPSTFRDTHVRT